MKIIRSIIILSVLLSLNVYSGFVPKSFQANFKKTVVGLIRASVSTGTLSYKYPGNIKFKTKSTLIVSNGRKIWYYRPPMIETEKGNLEISSSGRIKAAGMFDALNAKNSSEFKKEQKGDHLLFTLNQKAIDKYGIKKIEFIDASKKFQTLSDCQKMIIYTVNDKIETYELSLFKKNVKFSKKDFQFIPPINTYIKKR